MASATHEPFEFNHSHIKRLILSNYLRAWLMVLGSAARRGLQEKSFTPCYFDGFAGPGKGPKGEAGSPIVALRAAADVVSRPPYPVPLGGVVHVFCEKRTETYQNLRASVAAEATHLNLRIDEPHETSCLSVLLRTAQCEGGIWAILWHGDYRPALQAVLDAVADQLATPIFTFLDPTGYRIPFEAVQSVVRRRWTELLLTFMSGFMERFCRDPSKRQAISETFGDDQWQPGNWEELTGQYVVRLRRLREPTCVCAYRVRHARTSRGIYHLLHVSHSWKAAQLVKAKMWEETPPGYVEPEYAGRPHQSLTLQPQLSDLDLAVQYLANWLLDELRGKRVEYGCVEQRVECETVYTAKHLRSAISSLREAGYVETENPGPRGGLRADTILVFKPQAPRAENKGR